MIDRYNEEKTSFSREGKGRQQTNFSQQHHRCTSHRVAQHNFYFGLRTSMVIQVAFACITLTRTADNPLGFFGSFIGNCNFNLGREKTKKDIGTGQ
jgi:hypothetical protein